MKVSDLRGILQYVPRFRDRIFVVALDGEIVSSPNFANILLDLAVLRSLSIKVIIVHGASAQIAQLAAERGLTISNADGTGVTDDLTLKVGLEAATNVMNEIMQGLTSVDLRAVYANAIIAHPAGILGGVDHLHTGRVERVDTKALHLFLNEGITPVIPPIGFDGEGRTFRVNSDSIALEVAEAVQAMKIIYLSARDGVVVNGEMVKQLSIIEAEEIVKKRRRHSRSARIRNSITPRARAGSGVPRVHLLNGTARRSAAQRGLQPRRHRHDGLLERVPANPAHFQKGRARRHGADPHLGGQRGTGAPDARGNPRAPRRLLGDGNRPQPGRAASRSICIRSRRQAELACLYVAKGHEGQGYGRKLMAFAEQLAAEKGVKQMFALSTQAFNYFQQKGGYVESTPDILPPERRKKYDVSARNSRVMRKPVGPALVTEAARA